jgi:hypothetical protein
MLRNEHSIHGASKNLVRPKYRNCNHKGDEGTQRLFVLYFVRLFRLCGKRIVRTLSNLICAKFITTI